MGYIKLHKNEVCKFARYIDYKIENRHIVLYKQATPEVEAVKQQKSINGIVADEQGEPIIGASVLEKGTTNGTITDLDGRFT